MSQAVRPTFDRLYGSSNSVTLERRGDSGLTAEDRRRTGDEGGSRLGGLEVVAVFVRRLYSQSSVYLRLTESQPSSKRSRRSIDTEI